MPNMTLYLPEEIYGIVKKHSDIKWSEIARRAISEKAMKLDLIHKIPFEIYMISDRFKIHQISQ